MKISLSLSLYINKYFDPLFMFSPFPIVQSTGLSHPPPRSHMLPCGSHQLKAAAARSLSCTQSGKVLGISPHLPLFSLKAPRIRARAQFCERLLQVGFQSLVQSSLAKKKKFACFASSSAWKSVSSIFLFYFSLDFFGEFMNKYYFLLYHLFYCGENNC